MNSWFHPSAFTEACIRSYPLACAS
jgi:hypothetical protein